MIYLDNAATTWPKPEAVYQAVDKTLRLGGSPGRGGHSLARQADGVLFLARERLAALWGIADSSRVSFTLNATDGINIALQGCLTPGDTIVTTSMEHNAVARTLRHLASLGVKLRIIKCNLDGTLPIEVLKQALSDKPKALVLAHGSNVTGRVVELEQIRAVCPSETLLIIDAAQTAGVTAINVVELGIDILAASGHKGLLGPQGTGCLYVKEAVLTPLRFGGTGSMSEADEQPKFMPDSLESGTQNTPGIAGLSAGVGFIEEVGIHNISLKEQELAGELAARLASIPTVKVLGWDKRTEQTGVVSIVVAGDGGLLAKRLNDEGIICRAGLHCAPWAHQTLGTLATGTVRFSPGYFNTDREIVHTEAVVRKLLVGGS